jgi:hypothetical protein
MLGADSPIAHKAKPHVADILRGGRSAGSGSARSPGRVPERAGSRVK